MDNLIRKVLEKIDAEDCDEQLEEANDTGAGGEYMTPFAFSRKNKSEEELERERTSIRQTAFQTIPPKPGKNFVKYEDIESKWMKQITEISYPEYRNDESKTNRQKINTAIHEMNKMLGQMERTVKQNMKLKTEMGMDQSAFWKGTWEKFSKIDSRLGKLSIMVKELSK